MSSEYIGIRMYHLTPGDRVVVILSNSKADTNVFGSTTTTIVPLPAGAGFDELHGNVDIDQALADRGRVCLAFAEADDADSFYDYMTDNGAVQVSDPDPHGRPDDYDPRDDEIPDHK